MGESAGVGSTQGRIACFQQHLWNQGRQQLEYRFVPLTFSIPEQGAAQHEIGCPVCSKPLRLTVKSRSGAALRWIGMSIGAVLLVPFGILFTYMAAVDTSGDKFGRNVNWFFGIGGLVSAAWAIPWSIYRSRHLRFTDHVDLIAGAGDVVGHIGEGQPVPMHQHYVAD